MKKVVKSVADEIRFSDPLSVPELVDIEKEMIAKFSDLKDAVENKDMDKVNKSAAELSNLVKDRNSRVKSLKK